jgi:glucose-6-phosphate dehydrogenase assembly protein OpcA
MGTQLHDTNAAAIAAELLRARRHAGSPAMGMVLTLVVDTDEDDSDAAMSAALEASTEHPARIIGVIRGRSTGRSSLDAEIQIGRGAQGETVLIRLRGEVAKHAESVVLPLLLPDSPVVVWWPGRAPDDPAADPLGSLARRRITDCAAAPRAKQSPLLTQCATFEPGNTDLAWTRITGWRGLLAASLDGHPARVSHAEVTAEKVSPSAELLKAWLSDRLRVPVERKNSRGPGITAVRLHTSTGEIAITRPDGRLAILTSPDQPERSLALKRREIAELLAEELRRLDNDEVYEATIKRLRKLEGVA